MRKVRVIEEWEYNVHRADGSFKSGPWIYGSEAEATAQADKVKEPLRASKVRLRSRYEEAE